MRNKWFLEFVQVLAFSMFIGIAAYGAIIYWGGETKEKIPMLSSLFLGFGAVVCIVVIVLIGGLLDRIAVVADSEDSSELGSND